MRKKYFGLILGGFTLVLNSLAHRFPYFVERYYSRGLFLGVRSFLDGVLTWIPFPSLYLFFLGLVIYWIIAIKKSFGIRKTIKRRLLSSLIGLLNGVGLLLFWFYFSWGFNYARVPIEKTLGFDIHPITLAQIETKMKHEAVLLDSLRKLTGVSDTIAISSVRLRGNLEDTLRSNLVAKLMEWDFPIGGKVRGKIIYPKGVFLHFSSAGLYFPFVGEGNIDAGLYPLQFPPVITHEMAHGYGFGDEGTCNFLAYVANADSPNPLLAYAAHLSYYRTLASNFLYHFPKEYQAYRKTLPQGIVNDLNAINDNNRRYPDWMPKLRYYAYDHYLKSQGIKEGIDNYNRVLMLVDAWERS